jgi:hypothetical protein
MWNRAVFLITLPLQLFAQTSRVPFVGCAQDGQAGPVQAPKGTNDVVRIDAGASHKLAFYTIGGDFGVLAPRGWHCFGIYGSSGSELSVSPQPLRRNDFFSTAWSGPVVNLEADNGSGSGTSAVARVIARAFPAHWPLVRGLIANGDLRGGEYQFGPYPHDRLIIQTDSLVQFQTARHSEGLGTTTWLKAGDQPIDGVAILDQKTFDLLMLRVRLPRELRDLTPVIIHELLIRQRRDPW